MMTSSNSIISLSSFFIRRSVVSSLIVAATTTPSSDFAIFFVFNFKSNFKSQFLFPLFDLTRSLPPSPSLTRHITFSSIYQIYIICRSNLPSSQVVITVDNRSSTWQRFIKWYLFTSDCNNDHTPEHIQSLLQATSRCTVLPCWYHALNFISFKLIDTQVKAFSTSLLIFWLNICSLSTQVTYLYIAVASNVGGVISI